MPGPSGPRDALAPNAAGRWLTRTATTILDRYQLRRCHQETHIAMLQAMVASRAFQRDHGRLPRGLDELVPAYLPRVPVDAYDGAPLRYSREKRRLHSIGDDLRDAGGHAPADPAHRPEPTLSLDFRG